MASVSVMLSGSMASAWAASSICAGVRVRSPANAVRVVDSIHALAEGMSGWRDRTILPWHDTAQS